jgi:hypothetical protein
LQDISAGGFEVSFLNRVKQAFSSEHDKDDSKREAALCAKVSSFDSFFQSLNCFSAHLKVSFLVPC